MRLSVRNLTAALALIGAWGIDPAPVRAQDNPNVPWGGVPDQSVLNGLWWDGYNAFSPRQAQLAPLGGWWDFYVPPYTPSWNGPYYTAAHWDPYVPRPVRWTGLEYGVPDAPPDSTRPHGWYGGYSPGWRGDPAYAREFWESIFPELIPFAPVAVTGAPAEVLPPRAKPALRQYYRKPDRRGWETQGPRAVEPAPARGFTQYVRRDGRWVMKSGPVAAATVVRGRGN